MSAVISITNRWRGPLLGGLGALIALTAVPLGFSSRPWLALATHLLGAALALTLMRDRRDFAVLLWAFTVPALGPLIAWLHQVGAQAARETGLFANYLDYLDVSARVGNAAVNRTDATPTPAQVAPLAEVLDSGADDALKRSAIEGLARLETPEAIDQLRHALGHASVEVRFYAAGALEHLEARLSTRLEIMERAYARAPDGDPQAQLDLARACFDFSWYRLARDQRHRDLVKRTLQHALRAAERGAGAAALLLAGRACLELRQFERAAGLFQRFHEQQPGDGKGLLWLAEARYHLGQYAEVRACCRDALAAGAVPAAVQAPVWMWAGET